MTDKKDIQQDDELDLEQELAKLTKEEKDKTDKHKEKEDKNVGEKIQILEKKLSEQEEITKKAQHNYIDLKMDFERLVRQTQEKEKNMKVDSTINVTKKLLPFVESLRKSLQNIEDAESNPFAKGLALTYENFIKTLEELGIKTIETLGMKPDTNLHIPVGMKETQDKKLKGKIIEEFEQGFIYKKDGIEKIILPAKVIIGQ